MVNGVFHFLFCSHYFGLKSSYAAFQLLDRQWIKILTRKRDEWIVGTFRKKIFDIHDTKVDPSFALVNNAVA